MKKFIVVTEFKTQLTYEVDAENEKEASDLALSDDGDLLDEDSWDAEVVSIDEAEADGDEEVKS